MSRPPPAAAGQHQAGVAGEGRERGRRPRTMLSCWPALLYPAAILAASVAVQARPAAQRDRALLWASTNLDNLADHPVTALAASAFVADGDVVAWIALAALGMAGLVVALRLWRAVAVAVTAHVLATAVSEGSLAVRIAHGLAPASQRAILDVGPSFAVVGVLVATVVCGRGPWWRAVAAAGFLALTPSIFDGLASWDVAAVGHVTAVVVGLAAGTWFVVRWSRLTPPSGRG